VGYCKSRESEFEEQICGITIQTKIKIPRDGWDLHASFHCLVENQIALEVESVRETVAKLMRQGLSRHEAIHAIAALLGDDIFSIMKSRTPFDEKRFRRRLNKLTARRWRKGQY
jgi:uncharacterized protein YoaH (UPF0181 family)